MHPSFDLTGRVAVITGGCGLLGQRHARAIAAQGGIPVLVDLPTAAPQRVAETLARELGSTVIGFTADITDEASVAALLAAITARFPRIHILINNAANNPKQEDRAAKQFTRLEHLSIAQLKQDIDVGIIGAVLMAQQIGGHMAAAGGGVILNIASDLAVIAPDQRLYREPGAPPHEQPVKPVSYSLVKTALLGLTRYLATYWAEQGIRVNALSPGGVYNNQPEDFVVRLNQLIPMGRMANRDEYEGAVIFLCSEASSYMTGANLVIDGGRSCW